MKTQVPVPFQDKLKKKPFVGSQCYLILCIFFQQFSAQTNVWIRILYTHFNQSKGVLPCYICIVTYLQFSQAQANTFGFCLFIRPLLQMCGYHASMCTVLQILFYLLCKWTYSRTTNNRGVGGGRIKKVCQNIIGFVCSSTLQ